MTTNTQVQSTNTEHQDSSKFKRTAAKNVKSLQAFFTKFNNDWVMNFAAGLAFNLITAIFPIVIAIISIVGLTIGRLDPTAQQNLINHILSVFPQQISSGGVLTPVFNALKKNAGFLGIIAILLAIFGGSRLFVTMEGYFDIIYHTRPRDVIKQNVMAVCMLLVFIVLVPLMVFASSIPALIQSLLQTTLVSQIPGNGLIYGLIGIIAAVIISWILFEAIYLVVPNEHISIRHSWLGALVAAVAVQAYLILFPFYVTHFLGSYTGTAGFAVILLFFFYYFAVILLLGAEINAFFAEGIRATPANLVEMVHQITSHLPTNEKDMHEQATLSHKHEEPKDIRPKSEANRLEAQAAQANNTPTPVQSAPADRADHRSKKRKSSSQGASRTLVIVEVVAGTTLAFLVQLFGMRRKK
jgi:membrane protein